VKFQPIPVTYYYDWAFVLCKLLVEVQRREGQFQNGITSLAINHMCASVLTNVALPTTSATLTLRIIKSFEYRTEKSLVLHGVNLETTTVGELMDIARQGILFPRSAELHELLNVAVQAQSGWKPYRNVVLGSCFAGLYHVRT
jgi:Uncharacterized conserved protein (DUF2340)